MKNKISISLFFIVLMLVFVQVGYISAFAYVKDDFPMDLVNRPRSLSSEGFAGYDNWLFIKTESLNTLSNGNIIKRIVSKVYVSDEPISVTFGGSMEHLSELRIIRPAGTFYQYDDYRYVNGEFYSHYNEGVLYSSYTSSNLLSGTNLESYEYYRLVSFDYGGQVNATSFDGDPLLPMLPEDSNWISAMKDWEPGVRITLPQDGYKQSQINIFSTWFAFKIPETPKEDVYIGVNGYISGTLEDDPGNKFISYGGYSYGLYGVSGYVPFNENHSITVLVRDGNGNEYTDIVKSSLYEGFVDDDNDGLDDRAGDTFYNRDTGSWEDYGTFDLSSAIDGVSNFFQMLYGVIPAPIMSIVIAGVGFLLVLGIKRLIL